MIDCSKVIQIPIKCFTHRENEWWRWFYHHSILYLFDTQVILLQWQWCWTTISLSARVAKAKIIDIQINFDINANTHTYTHFHTYKLILTYTIPCIYINMPTPLTFISFYRSMLFRIESNLWVSISYSNRMIRLTFFHTLYPWTHNHI